MHDKQMVIGMDMRKKLTGFCLEENRNIHSAIFEIHFEDFSVCN